MGSSPTADTFLLHFPFVRKRNLQSSMPNIASQCFGSVHGLVEEAISRSEYTFVTIEEICVKTNVKLLDVQYTLSDMRDAQMITITDNRVMFTDAMIKAKETF